MTERRAPYRIEVRENGHVMDARAIVDPFIHTRIVPRGWRAAWNALWGRTEFTVVVDAEPEIIEQVLELDPDYLGAWGSERRRAWDRQMQNALQNFADSPA